MKKLLILGLLFVAACVVNGSVCGTDGQTYESAALAKEAGVEFTQGVCPAGIKMQVFEVTTPQQARDIAIMTINSDSLVALIPLGDWAEEESEENLVGFETKKYTHEAWAVYVSYPSVEEPTYHVEIFDYEKGRFFQRDVEYNGDVDRVEPQIIRGTVVVTAEGSRSESWGISTEEMEIGLQSYTQMKYDLKDYLGSEIHVVVGKICTSFEEQCCTCAFEMCAPNVISWTPVEIGTLGGSSYKRVYRVRSGSKVYKDGQNVCAWIDALDKNKDPYRKNIKIKSFSYYPVERDGYVGVVSGEVSVR